MVLIRSKLTRLAAAIGIGLLAETLLFGGTMLLADQFPRPWDERIFALGQEPAYHLVGLLWAMQRHGFEEQAGFVILVPLIQWVFWSTISYWVLSRRAAVSKSKS